MSGGIGVNPVVDRRSCWKPCISCFKCEDYGTRSACATCPGRVDVTRRMYPDPDSYCDCKNGILRHRVKATGQLIVRKFMSSPYGGTVQTDSESADEQEWNQFIADRRNTLQDPDWDPIRFNDGTSTKAWSDKFRAGRGW